MLEIENLSVSRGGRCILGNINLSIPENSTTILIGKNGSGKTTLADSICGALPYSGNILLGGVALNLLSPKQRAQRIAYLPQLLPSPHITVRELIALGRSPYTSLTGRLSAEDISACEKAVELTGIEPFLEKFTDELSGGEHRRAYLAMTLAQDADVLILDEPTTHMDISASREFLDMLTRLQKAAGKTLLIILHDLTDAIKYGGNVAVLDSGELAFFGTRKACLDNKVIETGFSVRRIDADGEIIFSA